MPCLVGASFLLITPLFWRLVLWPHWTLIISNRDNWALDMIVSPQNSWIYTTTALNSIIWLVVESALGNWTWKFFSYIRIIVACFRRRSWPFKVPLNKSSSMVQGWFTPSGNLFKWLGYAIYLGQIAYCLEILSPVEMQKECSIYLTTSAMRADLLRKKRLLSTFCVNAHL